MTRKRKFSHGFTVVEIIVAAALFLIFSSGAIAAVVQAFDANRTASEETIANQYATEGIEAVRSIRNQSFANLTGAIGWSTGVNTSSGVWNFTGNGTNNQFGKYTRAITVANVYRDTCGTGNIVTSGGQLDPNTMKVMATVTWNVSPTRNDSVVETTYLTNWHATIGWYQNWQYRKKITISNTQVSGGSDLSNFPVLINFANGDSDLQANAQTNGNDILFTDSSGTNKLNHEIEKYNSSNGSLQAWVNVPALSSSMCTVLYMYYGNSAPNQQNKTSVWNNNYRGVWHLDELSGTQHDSTSYANDLTTVNVTTEGAASGIIDGADQFVHSNINGLKTAVDSSSLLPTDLAVSAWVKPSSFPTSPNTYTIIKNFNSSSMPNWNAYILELDFNHHVKFDWINSSGTEYPVLGSTVLSPNQWYLIMGIYNSVTNNIAVYVNGANDSGSGVTTSGSILNANGGFIIGDNANITYAPDGIIDEPRVEGSARSSGWIATEYNNQNSPSTFYTVSTAQGQ